MAALTGLIKIVNGASSGSSVQMKFVEEQICPQILTVITSKPFIGPRELCFKVLRGEFNKKEATSLTIVLCSVIDRRDEETIRKLL